MKKTIEQILEMAVLAHKKGNFQEAEELYRTILRSNPLHSDTNHNLGVLAVSFNKFDKAIPFFETAIKSNPDVKQYWLSYIDILIKNKNFVSANKAIEDGKKNGVFKSEHFQLFFNMAFKQHEIGKLEEARESYMKAIGLQSNYAQAHNNLGIVLQEMSKLEEARESYIKAIDLQPDYAEAHNNLGIVFQRMNKLEKARESYMKAIDLQSDYPEAHFNLGNVLSEIGKTEQAKDSISYSIKLKPNFTDALINRSKLSFDKGEFESALEDLNLCNNQRSRALILETLYALGLIEEIYKIIDMNSELDDRNIRVASFSSFISSVKKKKTSHNFCPDPLSFIYYSNISSQVKDYKKFITELIDELNDTEQIWEPYNKSTLRGFQTPPHINLFESPINKIKQLKLIILNELDEYFIKFRNNSCSYIKKWPSKKNLNGWQVVLKHQGYQSPHIHPTGWLSGVIYLKVVPSLGKDEGSIEFSLNGPNYSDIGSPNLKYHPEIGDIVLFPSSLHHRTIPFSTDTDRVIISFDLLPE